MALEAIKQVSGRAVYVPGDDIDTDRITPARYLKVVTFDGLGEALFHDERFNPDGSEKPHPLNDPRFKGARIMLVGANFGCGSSREHAPQAIYRAGFRALIGESFAEIFFGNATTLSMPCVTASKADIAALAQAIEEDPGLLVTVDVERLEVRYADKAFQVGLPPTAQKALVEGRWDPIADLLEATDLIQEAHARLPRATR
ncbi:3-isopropylmalate dehydratase small subunit [Meiothermus luteus]|jgi:3-isopropylmalate/(R)-2-methylmalate dehydratase small subunit|uniref:3-isopropylmalate dehydratase n=1 Tax=Meiothermus luteus TaxID=2026184 RepID=A0A399EP97_9DEIN|nr:3-isopropylmalate dehydratase small subunit [Meiothermus luteus]RIH84312.1 3-isopropylmalate dehydratase small subunit [Meiothermus luteus]RMH56122.1 MAG: 3-isopropylmalate dehydratase small subunit [Deinococcota bacterium]